ncbi:MAG: hypothetical protein RJA19_332 [Bacteroidota bacterium]
MKKLFLTLALGAVGLGGMFAQQYKGVVKTNPLGYFAGQYMIGYEHMLTDRMSVQLMPGLVSQNSSQSWNYGTEVYSYEQKKSGFIVIPEFRYYVSPDRTGAPHGLYVAALARVLMLTYDLEDTGDLFPYGDLSREDKRTVFGGGAVLGYQYATSGGFTLEAFAGPQFKSVSFDRTYDSAAIPTTEAGDALFEEKFADISLSGVDNSGAGLRFGVNIGYAF